MQSASLAAIDLALVRVLRGGLLLLCLCTQLPAQQTVPAAPVPSSAGVPASAADLPEAPAPCPPRAQNPASTQPSEPPASGSGQSSPLCPPTPASHTNWYTRFLNGPAVKPMTPAEKARLAARNLLDPFNALTILGTSSISVAANSHSAYGPGMKGFGKDVGTSYSQDLTGEFFGTFLIPSLVHQDPHYHRMPSASVPRRVGHTLVQVVWTRGDNGQHMLNYANIVGFAIEDAIGDTYLPGRDTSVGAGATRYAVWFALAPEDNLITEFLPDVARRIHVRSVFLRRIVNQVARPDAQ